MEEEEEEQLVRRQRSENTTVFYLYIKLLSHTLANMISVYESAPAPCPPRPSPARPGYVKCKCGKLFNDFSEFETEYVSALRRSGKYHDDEAKYLHTQTCQTQPVALIPGEIPCNCQLATGKWQTASGRRQAASGK